MVEIHDSIVIQTSENSVWEFISNLENITRWYSKMVGYGKLDEGDPGVGT